MLLSCIAAECDDKVAEIRTDEECGFLDTVVNLWERCGVFVALSDLWRSPVLLDDCQEHVERLRLHEQAAWRGVRLAERPEVRLEAAAIAVRASWRHQVAGQLVQCECAAAE